MLSGRRPIGSTLTWLRSGRNSVLSSPRLLRIKWSMSKMNVPSDHHLAWPECDVVMLGGGPAGAAAAITLACAGRSVVVIEKSHYEQARIEGEMARSARVSLIENPHY